MSTPIEPTKEELHKMKCQLLMHELGNTFHDKYSMSEIATSLANFLGRIIADQPDRQAAFREVVALISTLAFDKRETRDDEIPL